MQKRKFARVAALGSAAVLTAALISSVVATSGAYFTDSKPGAITGNLGSVKVDASGMSIDFANLLPGEVQTQTVTVSNNGSGPEDMYLAFDNANLGWSAVNNLGQYGTFVINGNVYDNLSNSYAATNLGVAGTPSTTDFMSRNTDSSCGKVGRVPVNYLPHTIFLGTWAKGQTATFTIGFNFNACLTGGAGGQLWQAADAGFLTIGPVPLIFKVAAFQPTVKPNDQMNGTGMIADLKLPIAGDTRPVGLGTPAGTFQ